MKRVSISLLAVLLLLTGCTPMLSLPTTEPVSFPTEERETEGSTVPVTETMELTLPPHSPLYIEGLSTDAAVLYFEEVCLDAEIVNSGDPARLQKWDAPILYQVLGDPTAEDLDTIRRMEAWLNSVDGFPGIREAQSHEYAGMDIFFCSSREMADRLGDWTWGCDGGVTFWYDMDVIHTATICVRSDIDQELRSSVILEEIYNSLGPVQDTDLREDSIIWSGFSQPQWLTAEDMLLIRLLYDPSLVPGMDAGQCADAIRAIYY